MRYRSLALCSVCPRSPPDAVQWIPRDACRGEQRPGRRAYPTTVPCFCAAHSPLFLLWSWCNQKFHTAVTFLSSCYLADTQKMHVNGCSSGLRLFLPSFATLSLVFDTDRGVLCPGSERVCSHSSGWFCFVSGPRGLRWVMRVNTSCTETGVEVVVRAGGPRPAPTGCHVGFNESVSWARKSRTYIHLECPRYQVSLYCSPHKQPINRETSWGKK